MALSSPVSEAVYTGNGTTTVFPTVFKFFNNADVIVQRQNPGESNPTQLTEGVHYTLTGAGVDGGGNVTMLSAPVSGATLTIRRSVFFTQPTAFQAQGSFSPKLHENALDYVTMQTQQLQRDASDLADTVADQAADIAALTTTVNSDVSTLNAAIVTGDNTVRSEFAAALAAAVLGAGGGGSSQPFDVKTYGALGNGIADDTAPIQAALDAAGTLAASTGRRCAVYLPPGKYMISKPLFMTQATALFTDSRGAAIIEAFTTFRGYSLICGPNYSTLVQGPFAIGSFSTPGQFSYAWSQKDGFNGSYFDLGQTAEGRLPDNANWTVNIKFKFANTLTDGRRVWGAEGEPLPKPAQELRRHHPVGCRYSHLSHFVSLQRVLVRPASDVQWHQLDCRWLNPRVPNVLGPDEREAPRLAGRRPVEPGFMDAAGNWRRRHRRHLRLSAVPVGDHRPRAWTGHGCKRRHRISAPRRHLVLVPRLKRGAEHRELYADWRGAHGRREHATANHVRQLLPWLHRWA
jgi:hypothetical protein